MVARGDSYEKAVKALKERFEGVSERDIRRLVFTEGTFLTNEAQAQVHQSEYEYYALACADARACEVCKALEREQLAHPARFDEREPGVNFPPMHPWCRCGYTIEVPDYEEWEAEYASRHGSTPPERAKVERGRSMPEIAGINPGAPMGHDDADSGRVNPHFLEGREGRRTASRASLRTRRGAGATTSRSGPGTAAWTSLRATRESHGRTPRPGSAQSSCRTRPSRRRSSATSGLRRS